MRNFYHLFVERDGISPIYIGRFLNAADAYNFVAAQAIDWHEGHDVTMVHAQDGAWILVADCWEQVHSDPDPVVAHYDSLTSDTSRSS